MFSIRIDRCISPLPATKKESVLSVSVTRRDTSFSSSLYRRSRSWREVTNLPSRPASGLSLTENVISTVGSLIFVKLIGSKLPAAQIVSPMLMPSIPEIHTISPTVALCVETRWSCSIWSSVTSFAVTGFSSLWKLPTCTC